MSDVHELLEELATDGAARGADAVFTTATVQASRHRRVRRRRRGLSAVATAVALVSVVSVVSHTSSSGRVSPRSHVGVEGTTSTTLASATAAQIAAGHWSTIPAGPLSARTATAEVWTGRELVVWGGHELRAQRTSNDGAEYDPTTRTWRMLPPAPLTPRASAVAVWTGTEVVIWGGVLPEPAGRVTPGSVEAAAYNPATNSWRSIGAPPIPPTDHPLGIWTGDRVVVFSSASAASYDPIRERWQRLPSVKPAHPPLHWIFAAAAGSGRFLAWSQTSGFKPLPSGASEAFSNTDLLRYDESPRRWTSLAHSPDAMVQPEWAAWTGDRLLVRGSDQAPYSQGPADPVGAWYDPESGVATGLPRDPLDAGPSVAIGALSAWTGQALWSFDPLQSQGGSDFHVIPPGRAEVFNPTDTTWRKLERAPFGCESSPVWTGTSVLAYCAEQVVPQGPRLAGGLEYVAG